MIIKIYDLNGTSPVEIWEDYPFVPNVGDMVSTPITGAKIVAYRTFRKDEVCVRIK